MTPTRWQESRLRTGEVDLALYEAGQGPVLVFLHGGPGHDHRLLRPLAELLAGEYRCVLADQRGSGCSNVDDLNGLHVDQLVEDIEALRVHLRSEHLTLVGWSWGAALAMLYGAAHPERISGIAAIAPGPILWHLVEVYRANQLRPLNAEERLVHARLTEQMDDALRFQDAPRFRALDRQLVELTIRTWFYEPQKAREFLTTYLATAGDPYNAALVSRQILGSLGEFSSWDRLGAWRAPTLVVYGYQDFEPITQAYLIKDWAPQTQLAFINECGHYPWLEQPEQLSAALRTFLQGTSSQ